MWIMAYVQINSAGDRGFVVYRIHDAHMASDILMTAEPHGGYFTDVKEAAALLEQRSRTYGRIKRRMEALRKLLRTS